jgi:hypothetical protein
MYPCANCGKEFKASVWQRCRIKKGKMICCSKNCLRLKISELQSGSNNSFFGKTHTDKVIKNIKRANYKTGKSIINGYVVLNPVRGVRNNPIKEHRYKMERHLGRKLKKDEHIHHKDGNRLNNKLSNLCMLTPSQHTTLHNKLKGGKRNG